VRLFASLHPPDAVLEHLASALEAVRLGGDGGAAGPVRWSPVENWHLTLAFYGDVPDGAAHELEDGLAGLAASTAPFALRLRGAGVFAHRTLWVGVGGDTEAAVGLSAGAREIGSAVLGRSEPRERVRPHVTVGRVADEVRSERSRRRRRRPSAGPAGPDGQAGGRGADPLAGAVRALGVYEGPAWTVTDLRLVESHLGRGRAGSALHTDLARLELLGGRTQAGG
jgi:2'-5' RNA ligase